MKLNGSHQRLVFTIAIAAGLALGAVRADALQEEHDVAVPMRDGTILRANVYRPDQPGPYPVLVVRTPYNKEGTKPQAYVNAGYIVVTEDARGRYASEGKYESFYRYDTHDAADGYDTVEWAAKLRDSTGKVGTFGISYDAFLQWRLAPLRPPSLVAMSATSMPPRVTNLEGPGTIRPGRRLSWFYLTMSPNMRLHSGTPGPGTGAEARKLWEGGEEERLMKFRPVLDLPDDVFADEAGPIKDWLRAPYRDSFKLIDGCRDIAVPNLNVVGWYDHCNDSIELHQAMAREGKTETARKGSKLIIGPWNHMSHGARKIGDVDFGPEAALNVEQAKIHWFDYWIKGQANGVDQLPPVKIFVMGANHWRDESEWPLSRAKSHTLFLDSGGHANTPEGDGRLMPATGGASTDRYRYDPDDPVPTLWSKSMYTLPADQKPLAARRDILVYQTAPLAKPMEVTGYAEVILFAASSAPDTDFFARLIDVAPDGSARDVAMGMVRARFRDGLDTPQLIEPGKPTEYKIKLRPTSNEFLAGHRIRLDVTSSDFPNYDRNHNTAADQNADAQIAVAEQSVLHGDKFRSRIILPVIEK
jgi:putative CocE/NonD family hydrolase